jgi:hypothetical protein
LGKSVEAENQSKSAFAGRSVAKRSAKRRETPQQQQSKTLEIYEAQPK